MAKSETLEVTALIVEKVTLYCPHCEVKQNCSFSNPDGKTFECDHCGELFLISLEYTGVKMAKELPKLTPPSIVDWVNKMENYHHVAQLGDLPYDASLSDIKDAYDSERNTLQGIGEAIEMLAHTNLWPEIDDQ